MQTMNEVIKTIMERRSCRSFDPNKMPSEEVIKQICEAGTWAPTSRGQQNPIIIAVTNKQLRDRISRMNSAIITGNKLVTSTPDGADPFYGAPCMLIVLVKESPNAMYDGPIVMQTLMLAAQALGVNSIWIHRAKEIFESDEGKRLLKKWGIDEDVEGIGFCILGHAADDKEKTKIKPGRVFYVK